MLRFGICLAVVALATGPAAAQELHPDCPEDIETDEEAQDQAGVWFAKGEKLVTKTKYDKAVGAFLCAFALAPHPAPVFNAAQAALAGGNQEVAITYFKQYLSMAPAGPLADQARSELAKLEGQPEETTPAPAPPVAAFEPTTPPPAATEEETPWEEPAPAPEPAAEEDGPGPVAVTGWVFVGVGAAALVTGAVLQGLTGKAVTDGEEMSNYSEFEDQQGKVDGLQKGALIGFIAGGVLAGAGIVMVVVGDGDEEEGAEIALSPTPGGLSVGGTF